MMSRTGNKRGFTLIEIIVTTAILSLGIVAIYHTFFLSIDLYDYYSTYLKAASFADQKVWQAKDLLTIYGPSAPIAAAGKINVKDRPLDWYLNYSSLSDGPIVYSINMSIMLKRGNKEVKLNRNAYALYDIEKDILQ